jgi:hypothetical protein
MGNQNRHLKSGQQRSGDTSEDKFAQSGMPKCSGDKQVRVIFFGDRLDDVGRLFLMGFDGGSLDIQAGIAKHGREPIAGLLID